jgi:hypothetical protein
LETSFMPPFRFALPGALRLRTLQPLIDRDGACSLVYDLERAAVFEVPEELRLYVAPALETGNLDEGLLGWLASEDLLTAASSWETGPRSAAAGAPRARAGAASGGADLWWGQAPPWHGYDEAHGWIDQPEPALAIEAVHRVFNHGLGSPRVTLHLDWVGTFPAGDLFEAVVVEAGRRAMASGQEARFELALGSDQVTVEIARRLAAHPVCIRLRCGEYDPLARLGTCQENRPWLLAEPAVKLLLPLVPLLTVQCMLPGRSRLTELWRWAASIGVSSLDAIRLEDAEDAAGAGRPGALPVAAHAREYCEDLREIYEETCAELEAGRLPVDFQPLTRIVRRLRRDEAAAAIAGFGDELPMHGGGTGFAGVESLDPRLLPELMWLQLEGPAGRREAGAATAPACAAPAGAAAPSGDTAEPEAAPDIPCQPCWARQVCSHSAYVASPLGKEDPRDPSRVRCAFWSAEVEMAVRLFHRLAQIDAIQVQRFLENPPAVQAAAWPHLAWSLGGLAAKPS